MMRLIDAKNHRKNLLSEIGRFAILITLAGFFALSWGSGDDAAAAQMEDYCQVPPYVKRDVAPNIMFLMDNSNDMLEAAYSGPYDPAETYIGYFKHDQMYSYSSNVFTEDMGGDIDGNLMNWATMSRYDILQKVIIGGYTSSKQGNAHTLKSISGNWTKSDGGCTYTVSGGNLATSGTCPFSGGGGPCPDPVSDPASFPPSKGIGDTKKSPKIETNSLLDAEEKVCYIFGLDATKGSPEPWAEYTWSITAGSLPAGLNLHGPSGIIYGTPTDTAAGSYNFTVGVTDTAGKTASEVFTLEVLPEGSGGGGDLYKMNIDLIEEPLVDVNGNDAYDSEVAGENYTDLNGNGEWDGKKGVFHEFWDELNPRARWGLTAYSKDGEVLVEQCIPPNNTSSFFTDIQNASPSDTSPLADGLYGIIHYFAYDEDGNTSYKGSCDDPLDDVPCRQTFTLIVTSGTDVTATAYDTSSTPECANPGGDPLLDEPLVKNACYASNNDLRLDIAGKQSISTYIVQTFGTKSDVLEKASELGDGQFYFPDENDLEEQIRQAFQDILQRAASGTAASVLASGGGSGANLVQATFYPRRKIKDNITGKLSYVDWTGRLSSFWYFVDPRFFNAGIREDDESSQVLDLKGDNIVQFYFDELEEKTMAKRWEDTDGDGVADSQLADKEFELLDYLWEAGEKLWARDPATRKIWVNDDGKVIPFLDDNATAVNFKTRLQAADLTDARNIISYVRGVDDFDIDGDGIDDPVYRSRKAEMGGVPGVWKLGDIINSTPKILSWLPMMDYHHKYNDTTYGKPGELTSLSTPADASHFITDAPYKQRGTALVGANDGMLHAFKLGTFEFEWNGQASTEKARITNAVGIGEEQWAFIPENVLPYLKYLRETDYCHLYFVDLTPYVFDASIGSGAGDQSGDTKDPNDWRTIVIGSMQFGGACAPPADACTDCVKRPDVTVGYSSYFALDVTDTLVNSNVKPVLLWEFKHDDLGVATTGPAVVRVGPKDKNGDWFVVVGSGPTGPIDTLSQQFLGRSDQNLRLFVLNLKTGVLQKTIDTGIPGAFAGTLFDSTVDTDLDYQDEAVYVGYVRKDGAGKWETGGVGRLFTGESSDPATWQWETLVDGIGPVTSRIARLHDKRRGKLWLYFGTGRYFFNTGTTDDDPTNLRRIYGVKEPRYNGVSLGPSVGGALGGLTDVTGIAYPAEPPSGWYNNLDPNGTYPLGLNGADVGLNAERVITDPLATTLGVVFFVTYMPYQDVCAYGGKSFIWALQYSTGGIPQAMLSGKALVQTSTGSIEERDLSSAFTDKGGKRSSVIEGVPPTGQGLGILTSPPPLNRVLHRRER
jgi:type IV pilus assembly protein PilY1